MSIVTLIFLPPLGIGLVWLTDWPHNRKLLATGAGIFWWLAIAVGASSTTPGEAIAKQGQDSETVDSQTSIPGPTATPKETTEGSNTLKNLYPVTWIYDGDTLDVFKDNQTITVRLACIDAPESAQAPYGQASTDRLSSLVSSQVRLNVVAQDRYGRSVAEVYTLEGNFLNRQMIESGDAVVYTRYLNSCGDNSDTLIAAENQARSAGLGVWRDANFVMPWDYRQGVRAGTLAPESTVETPPVPATNLPACVNSDCNCSDFSNWRQAQAVLETFSGDPHRLDRDNDGIACESLR